MKPVSFFLSLILPAGMLVTQYTPDVAAEVSSSPVAISLATETTPLPAYTMAEVANHNVTDDCWLVIDDQVYDVTTYSPSTIDARSENVNCGRDITKFWQTGHTDVDEKLLPHFLIGTLSSF